MCRFLSYTGPEILLAELLHHPDNSLIAQSRHAKETREPTNADGFGVGWYTPEITPEPCVFSSITPAWSDRNLRNLAEHVQASCFFAHVRAASPGMRVSNLNCHPFSYGRYLWMHNGIVAGFPLFKRRLRNSLTDKIYSSVEGTTDSEHAFAVFLGFLKDAARPAAAEEIARALIQTVNQLEKWRKAVFATQPSYCNFAVTDGSSTVAVRFVSDSQLEPASLYYASGKRFVCRQGVCGLVAAPESEHSVILSSEKLTQRDSDWMPVPRNHVVTVSRDLSVKLDPIETARIASAGDRGVKP